MSRKIKIYTRTGDAGETRLLDGSRVSKSEPRVASYGDIDELNSMLGLAVAETGDAELRDALAEIQRDLFAIASQVADPRAAIQEKSKKAALGAERVAWLESVIDRYDERLPPLTKFILPGGSKSSALLHLSLCVCLRAERQLVALSRQENIPAASLAYLNRLSDLLFVLARWENRRQGIEDVTW